MRPALAVPPLCGFGGRATRAPRGRHTAERRIQPVAKRFFEARRVVVELPGGPRGGHDVDAMVHDGEPIEQASWSPAPDWRGSAGR